MTGTDARLDRIEELEAKLAKAVEALRTTTQILSQCLFETILVKGQYLDRKEVVASARATLAEIELVSKEGEKT
jgi:cytochrome oxidase assembly protein ShyY1